MGDDIDNANYFFVSSGSTIALLVVLLVTSYYLFTSDKFSLSNCATFALNLYRKFNQLRLRMRGVTPQTDSERRVVSGQVWEEFCDTLKASGASLLAPGNPTDPLTQAEGIRYLSRLLRGGLESFLECSDVNHPRLVPLADIFRDAPVSIGSPNPDNLYQNANLDSRFAYRLWGKRSTVFYLGFSTCAGSYGAPGGLQTVSQKDASDIVLKQQGGDTGGKDGEDDDATFELIISATKPSDSECPASNWLKLDPSVRSAMLIVRQTFMFREKEKAAEVHIERIDGDNRPSPLSAAHVEDSLQKTGLFVAGASMMFVRWMHGFHKHVNQLPLFDQQVSNNAGGDPQIRYYHSAWKLADDEALLITSKVPQCEHWNFQLNNHWMEALDARYFNIWINKGTAKYNHDGTVTVIVAHEDPSKLLQEKKDKVSNFNWIETCEHREGQMLWRWIKPGVPDEELPAPQPQVVKFNDLPSYL